MNIGVVGGYVPCGIVVAVVFVRALSVEFVAAFSSQVSNILIYLLEGRTLWRSDNQRRSIGNLLRVHDGFLHLLP